MQSFKLLMTFTYPHDAHMAKGYLESEGIEVMITDELTAQVNNFYSGAIGGVKLYVNSEDFDKGTKALIDGGYLVLPEKYKKVKIEKIYYKHSEEKEHCPYCKSTNISEKSKPNIFTVIFYFILGALLPIMKHTYICYDCEKEWKFVKEY